jgi:hypothetical protein
MIRVISCLILVLLLSGCATLDTVQPGSGSTFEVRGKTYDEVWNAVQATAQRTLTVVESNKGTGSLRAERGVGLTTWGEVVGIFVRPTRNGAPAYTVEVQSEKRLRYQLTGEEWTSTILDGIKAELGASHGKVAP